MSRLFNLIVTVYVGGAGMFAGYLVFTGGVENRKAVGLFMIVVTLGIAEILRRLDDREQKA